MERTQTELVNLAVEKWMAGDHMLYDECHDLPEVGWLSILEILKRGLSMEERSLLAAGPLEDLLAYYGRDFIDRVEAEARKNPEFNYLLGGVWQNSMPDDVWERVVKAREKVW